MTERTKTMRTFSLILSVAFTCTYIYFDLSFLQGVFLYLVAFLIFIFIEYLEFKEQK